MGLTHKINLGFHIAANTFNSQLYFDPAFLQYQQGNSRISIINPNDGDQFLWVRTDSSYENAKWDHGDFFLPKNIGVSGNGDVLIRYLYSNSLIDITSTLGRSTLEPLLTVSAITETVMKTQVDSTGRYRYLKLTLGTTGGTVPSFVQEWGVMEDTIVTEVSATDIIVRVEQSEQTGTIVKIPKGESRNLDFFFTTASGAFDLTGATVQFAMARSFQDILAGHALIIPATNGTLDSDPSTGKASVTLSSALTLVQQGTYVGEVKATIGATVIRRSFPVEILGTIFP